MPVVGAVLRGAGQIPVHREGGDAAQAFSSAVAAIEAGACIGIYPEGTLTRDPGLWPMVGKTGAARLALITGAPLVPVAQWGPEQVLMPYGKRPHLLPRRTVHVVAGPPADLDDLRDRPLDAPTLVEATRRVMDDVTTLLEGLRGETRPEHPYDPREHGERAHGTPGESVRRAQRATVVAARRRLAQARRLRARGRS
ncbi:hypothetical protein GCM10025868_40190 [Angustibacter aerolatus]|uniref:Phospholipid/glycerol acyltransferase domain-containing protein n=1 Tax=Angustibacter aerolatus TaxID=1162965 RepID=A0ABQ6JLK4_9ACTN|nr:hypothetical protein GCM10025868_40190 [Angustibacter aerolatus]